MAAGLYDKGREAFLNGQISWMNDTIKVALVGGGYVADMANDQFLSALGGNIVGTSMTLTSKSTLAGVANAAPASSAAIANGSTITQIVIFKDTGTAGTSPLIAREDVPTTLTNGGVINLTWDTGAAKIFKL